MFKSKKNIFLIIFCILVLLFIVELIVELNDPRSSGRDTVLRLGDGTYQVNESTVMYDEKLYQNYTLYEMGDILLVHIYKYMIDEESGIAYFIGKEEFNYDDDYTYLILDYKNEKYKTMKCYDEITDEFKIFIDNYDDFIEFENVYHNDTSSKLCNLN